MIANITEASPKVIDAELAELGWQEFKASTEIDNLQKAIARYEKDIEAGGYDSHWAAKHIEAAKADLAKAVLAQGVIWAAQRPLNAEFTRRGGWTRAYLVKNSNGHLHRSTNCNTCFMTTQFAWMTEVSGDDEAEIVDKAGDSACTVCYPTAPVALDPSFRKATQFEEPERKAARLEREARKAEIAAKKLATGITNPDGSELRGEYGVIKTERTAQIDAVTALADARLYGYRLNVELVERIVAALAHKRGESVETARAFIEAKAAAKKR